MTEEQFKHVVGRLDDIHGMQVGLAHALGLVLTALPPAAKALIMSTLPQVDEQLAASHLNSRYPDHVLETATHTFRALTSSLR